MQGFLHSLSSPSVSTSVSPSVACRTAFFIQERPPNSRALVTPLAARRNQRKYLAGTFFASDPNKSQVSHQALHLLLDLLGIWDSTGLLPECSKHFVPLAHAVGQVDVFIDSGGHQPSLHHPGIHLIHYYLSLHTRTSALCL